MSIYVRHDRETLRNGFRDNFGWSDNHTGCAGNSVSDKKCQTCNHTGFSWNSQMGDISTRFENQQMNAILY